MTPDDFLIQLMFAGNSNIFQYFVVILTLLLGLIEIVNKLYDLNTKEKQKHLYVIIYLTFSIVICLSSIAILNIIGAQNRWINSLSDNLDNTKIQNDYYSSKGIASILINQKGEYTIYGIILVVVFIAILIGVLIYIIYMNNRKITPNYIFLLIYIIIAFLFGIIVISQISILSSVPT